MMIIGIIARAIVCEPIRTFQWWSKHVQRGVMRSNLGACCYGIGGHDAMNQSIRSVRTAVEWDVHKNDGHSPTGDCDAAILSGRRVAADRLKDRCKLLSLKSGNRFSGSG
jgi:hypothetical protein